MRTPIVLFIYPDLGGSNISFSPAIEILSGFLQNKNIEVHLLHLHETLGFPLNSEKIYMEIQRIKPDLIGFTATSFQYQYSNQLAGDLKALGVHTPMVLGGIHAIISPDDLAKSSFDGFCTGEGELALYKLVQAIIAGADYWCVDGFHFQKEGRIYKNPPGEILEDLDQLPFRNYNLIDARKLLKNRNNWLSIAFSRGCPYSCSFCINQKLKENHRQGSNKPYFRCQSVDRAMQELVHWAKEYKGEINVFNLDDDLLLLNREWFLEFGQRYRDEIYLPYGIQYAINGRANLIDEEIAQVLKESGCYLLRIGFETGDEKLRNLILGKEIKDEHLYNTFSLTQKYQLRSLVFSMLGIPGEGHQTIGVTINMLQKLKPTLIRMAFFEPFIGTPLYDYCTEHGLLEGDNSWDNCFKGTTLKLEGISKEELQFYHLTFPWHLNINFVKEGKEEYESLIEKYKYLLQGEFEINQIKNSILLDDEKVSKGLQEAKIEHFRYFDSNNFYYELWNYNKEG
jgi:radical SAM superfamily enzyme YgiQ (UPF0313 family)